jgi:Bacterial lectin
MRRLQTLLATMLLLLSASGARAATVDETDWTLRDTSKAPLNWFQNGSARIAVNVNAFGIAADPLFTLRLTENRLGQGGAIWHRARGRLPSFTMTADVRVTFDPSVAGSCPADGFTLAFANCPVDAVGAPGGSLGIFEAGPVIRAFTAFEVNTWVGQGLGSHTACRGNNETFAFDVVQPGTSYRRTGSPGSDTRGGAKIGQVNPPQGMRLVNGGLYRYQFNADGATNTLTTYVTGLEEGNKQFQNVKVVEAKIGIPILNFEGRFGMTAATGAAVQAVDVFYTRIEVPMVPPQ